jgi:ABC-2 type transport system permease protein
MFLKVASFELRYQLRQPVFWVVSAVFFLLVFGAVASDQIRIGDGASVHKNSPYAIAQISLVCSVFFMFVTTAFVANVVLRDRETGFGPIVWTTPIRKFDYLFGRFTGAFLAAVLAFLICAPLPMMIGSAMPWLDPETIGPFRLAPYLFAVGVMALPGVFLTSAAFFALTTVTRSMMATYLGVIAFLVLWVVARVWARQLELERIVALFEPFGLGAYSYATRYWTSSERNALVPALSGFLLWNRLIVIAVSAGLLGMAYGAFGFSDRPARNKRSKATPARIAAAPDLASLKMKPRFGPRTALAQLAARTRLDVGQVILSPAFVVLLVLGMINSGASLWLVGTLFGTDIHPVTRVMIEQLEGGFTLFPIIIAIYYSGELVWRERDRRTHEIIDAAPLPDWAYVVPKTLAITLVLVATIAVSTLTAMVLQLSRGGVALEPGKYLLWYLLPNSVDMFLLAALAVFLQAISPHKFVGWGLMVLYLVATIVLSAIGLDHHLYLYDSGPVVPLSDMNGQGRFWVGAAWFRIYWSAFAVALLVLAYGLWRRGAETRLRPRLERLPRRLRSPAGVLALVALLVFAGSGAFIFVNTNVWNPYRSRDAEERWLADYEKTLLKYESTPQPRITDVRLDVDIRPTRAQVVTRGVYVIENRTSKPLREIHVRFPRDLVMRSLSIEGARPTLTYDRFHYRIFAFDTPMAPGERRRMAFETVLSQRGFKNDRDLTSVVPNGTFLNDRDIAPTLGMDRRSLLQDRAKRAKYGLPRELRMPKLGTPGADQVDYLGHDADWVNADIRVSTDADQTPIAPGVRVFDRTSGGRRTAEFRTDAPIQRFFSIQSARYAVKRALLAASAQPPSPASRGLPPEGEDLAPGSSPLGGSPAAGREGGDAAQASEPITLAVFYHPAHAWNVERMLAAARAAIAYDQANFGPYQFHELKFLEFPAFDGKFAQSFAGTVPWSEDLGFIADLPKSSDKIDYVTYVGAHEIAHQWWAHQLIGADEQGSTVLSETLAQYSALMVMKHMYGPDMIRRFLKYELDQYLAGRGADPLPEQPLERVENQQYIHYRKGSLVMYRLQDEIGEDAVNRALRSLLARYAFKGPPYPTSLDLVAALRAQAPPDKQGLITDLFEKIALYDLKAVRASSRRRSDGRYDVTLTISAKKLYADGHGQETAAPMDEAVDVGLFLAEPGKPGFAASKVLWLKKLPIRSGVQTLHLFADKPPRFAGVDPYNELIDRNADDNVAKVQ